MYIKPAPNPIPLMRANLPLISTSLVLLFRNLRDEFGRLIRLTAAGCHIGLSNNSNDPAAVIDNRHPSDLMLFHSVEAIL